MSNPSAPEFQKRLKELIRGYMLIPWFVGDLINQFLDVRGDEGYQYVDARKLGVSEEVLLDWIRTADKFDNPEDRLEEKLSIWYYKEVRNLPHAEAIEWIKKTIKNKWTLQELRRAVRESRQSTTSSREQNTFSSQSDSPPKGSECHNQNQEPQASDRQSADSD